MRRSASIFLVVSACMVADVDDAPESDQGNELTSEARTVVSLTFDDTLADQYQVGALTAARGMRATFFVNSGRIGQSGYMTRDQLLALQSAGHEIGGHTITHVNLTTLSFDDAKRQVCNDRVALLAAGLRVANFAYPFSGQNATVRQIVRDCGYNSARLVGGLVDGSSCASCPYANPRPPPDPYQIRTNDSIHSTTTLAQLQRYVTQAEQNGGGWVPIVFHHVCNGCNPDSVSLTTLTAFLDWLRARGPTTQVGTVRDVIGGTLQPGVAGPPVGSSPPPPTTTGNLLRNASLETDSNGDQVPDCWQRDSFGTNSATYSLVSPGFNGSVAQRITMTSFTSGARRLRSTQDSGTCAPAVVPGHRYRVGAYYITNAPVIFSVFYRTQAGSWAWLAESSALPRVTSYTRATFTTPPMPSGATAISVGLSVVGLGTLTEDAYDLVDIDATTSTTDTTPPTARISSPTNGSTVRGIVTIVADVSDNVGVYRVRFYLDGQQLGSRVQTTYRWNWDTTTVSTGSHQLAIQAEDAAGNATRSASITVTVAR